MKNISVSNVQEYNINGKVVIRFNPMDTGFVKRFLAACEELAKRQEAFGKEAEEAPADNFFPVAEKADARDHQRAFRRGCMQAHFRGNAPYGAFGRSAGLVQSHACVHG